MQRFYSIIITLLFIWLSLIQVKDLSAANWRFGIWQGEVPNTKGVSFGGGFAVDMQSNSQHLPCLRIGLRGGEFSGAQIEQSSHVWSSVNAAFPMSINRFVLEPAVGLVVFTHRPKTAPRVYFDVGGVGAIDLSYQLTNNIAFRIGTEAYRVSSSKAGVIPGSKSSSVIIYTGGVDLSLFMRPKKGSENFPGFRGIRHTEISNPDQEDNSERIDSSNVMVHKSEDLKAEIDSINENHQDAVDLNDQLAENLKLPMSNKYPKQYEELSQQDKFVAAEALIGQLLKTDSRFSKHRDGVITVTDSIDVLIGSICGPVEYNLHPLNRDLSYWMLNLDQWKAERILDPFIEETMRNSLSSPGQINLFSDVKGGIINVESFWEGSAENPPDSGFVEITILSTWNDLKRFNKTKTFDCEEIDILKSLKSLPEIDSSKVQILYTPIEVTVYGQNTLLVSSVWEMINPEVGIDDFNGYAAGTHRFMLKHLSDSQWTIYDQKIDLVLGARVEKVKQLFGELQGDEDLVTIHRDILGNSLSITNNRYNHNSTSIGGTSLLTNGDKDER